MIFAPCLPSLNHQVRMGYGPMPFAKSLTVLAHHICHVALMIPKEKMGRVATSSISSISDWVTAIARMANHQSRSNFTKCQPPCKIMSIRPMPIKPIFTIASPVQLTSPKPTILTFFDVSPKGFFRILLAQIPAMQTAILPSTIFDALRCSREVFTACETINGNSDSPRFGRASTRAEKSPVGQLGCLNGNQKWLVAVQTNTGDGTIRLHRSLTSEATPPVVSAARGIRFAPIIAGTGAIRG